MNRPGRASCERAVRLVFDHLSEYPSNATAIAAVAHQGDAAGRADREPYRIDGPAGLRP
ncbi:hypothetical protein GH740_12550 [Microbacterium sp. SYP-A9085]|nr:hypothetical protein [Microbacterium sp. SYP-A9085]